MVINNNNLTGFPGQAAPVYLKTDRLPDNSRPWLRRIVVTLGPLEEWRGAASGQTVRFESNGTPEGLQVNVSVQRTLMGSPPPSSITVRNLAADTRDAIRASLTKVTVEAGWKNTELHKVFQGSVLSAVTERGGTDITTRISAIPGYGALVRGVAAKTFSPGTPVQMAVMELAGCLPGLTVSENGIQGVLGNIGGSGWSFAGSARDALTQLAMEHGFSWHVDDGQFKAVGDKAVFGGCAELSGNGGALLGVSPALTGPLQVQTGVAIRALYIPGVTPGSSVRVNSTVSPKLNGLYRVNNCRLNLGSHGEQWTMDIDSFHNQGDRG